MIFATRGPSRRDGGAIERYRRGAGAGDVVDPLRISTRGLRQGMLPAAGDRPGARSPCA